MSNANGLIFALVCAAAAQQLRRERIAELLPSMWKPTQVTKIRKCGGR